MALKISLKPGERIAVNGAVLINGARRSSLVIENKARVLREIDIMQPAEADTPAKRVYLPIMLMYLDPTTRDAAHTEFEKRLLEFVGAIRNREILARCATLSAHVVNGDYYKALSLCRQLIDYEKTRLENVA